MPFHKTVHSKQFTVNRNKSTDTVYRLPSTVHNRQKRFGFTIIELLIVTTIIGVLALVSYSSFTNAQMKTRDKKRKEEIKATRDALVLWKLANPTTSYPQTGSASTYIAMSPLLVSYLETTYIKKIPSDPLVSSGVNIYKYIGTPYGATECNVLANNIPCTGFEVIGCLENSKDQDRDMPKRGTCSTTSYSVYSPN